MHVFEITPKNRWITFGELANSNLVFKDPDDNRRLLRNFHFYTGNYDLSAFYHGKNSLSSSIVVIHQENVDPEKLLGTLHEFGQRGSVSSNLLGKRRAMSIRLFQKSLEAPVKPTVTTSVFPVDKHMSNKCGLCKNSSSRFNHAQVSPIEEQLLHRIYDAHINDGHAIATAKALQYRNLFYFVSESSWPGPGGKSTDDLKIYLSSPSIYEIKLDGKKIGFAVSLKDLIEGPLRVTFIIDSTGDQYAVVFQNDLHGKIVLDSSVFEIPIETVLYETEHRSFQQGTKRKKTAFDEAGSSKRDDSSDQEKFAFARLPSDIFVMILRYLPWNEGMLCRRVSKRWFVVGNAALVARTKEIVDTIKQPFRNLKTADLERLLPIVAGGLEVLVLQREKCSLNFSGPFPVLSSLREVNLGWSKINHAVFFDFLGQCPHLKKLTLEEIPKLPKSSAVPATICRFEELVLLCYRQTDQSLMAVADLFPNLVSLSIEEPRRISTKGISNLIKRLKNLHCFSITGNPRRTKILNVPVVSNLTSLSIIDDMISDSVLIALANGCVCLESLDLTKSRGVTNNGLAALAALENLKNLNISRIYANVSEAVSAIAVKGRLQQLCSYGCSLSFGCLWTCLRYCTGLQLLDIRSSDNFSLEETKEIVGLFGHFGRVPRLVIRASSSNWLDKSVYKIQKAIKNGKYCHQGRLFIDSRWDACFGFLKPEDDKLYQNGLVFKETVGCRLEISGNSDDSDSEKESKKHE